jgi:capsular exopolysaccharide synthesis family protein
LKDLALKPQSAANIPVLVEVLKSPLLLQPIAAKLGVKEDKIIQGLTVKPLMGGADGVLDVNLEWGDRQMGQEILEALKSDYLAFAQRQRQKKLAQGLSFLDAQSPALMRKVADLQEQLSSFRRRNDFLEPIKQGEAVQVQRQQLETSMGVLRQREAQLLGSMAAARAGKFAGSSSLGSGSQGSGAELVNKMSDLEKELAEAEGSYLPDSPQVMSLRERLSEVKALVKRKQLDAIDAALSQLRSEQAELERQHRDLTRRFASNPGLVKQYDAIQQRLDVARQNFASYIRTREDFRLAEAQRAVPWGVISPPKFKEKPVKPNLRLNSILTLLLGVIAGGGAALLADRLNHRYHQSVEVERDLKLPLLGEVPFLSHEAEGSSQKQKPLRELAIRLQLLPKPTDNQLILIASSVSGEGRSRLTAWLGQTLAELGQRVLLVDADLHAPTLHLYLGANNTSGLFDLLTNAGRGPEELIQPMSPNLHVLSAGSSPGEASSLLGSPEGRRVLQSIRNLGSYDFVLFDSPATLLVGDALLLSREVDGVVVLVGLELVERSKPAQALERLRTSGADLLGVVTNRPSP